MRMWELDAGAHLDDLVAIARGASWLGCATFYFVKIPVAMSLKIPCASLALSALIQTRGIGAYATISAAVKAVWIIARLFLDFATDSGSTPDIRFVRFASRYYGRSIRESSIASGVRWSRPVFLLSPMLGHGNKLGLRHQDQRADQHR